jgi:hypothetical protein
MPAVQRDDMIVLEISDKYETRYLTISESILREISQQPELAVRNRMVWAESEPFAIHTDALVDYGLVLDGSEDVDSWNELFDR